MTLRVSDPSGYLDPSKSTRKRESGGEDCSEIEQQIGKYLKSIKLNRVESLVNSTVATSFSWS